LFRVACKDNVFPQKAIIRENRLGNVKSNTKSSNLDVFYPFPAKVADKCEPMPE